MDEGVWRGRVMAGNGNFEVGEVDVQYDWADRLYMRSSRCGTIFLRMPNSFHDFEAPSYLRPHGDILSSL